MDSRIGINRYLKISLAVAVVATGCTILLPERLSVDTAPPREPGEAVAPVAFDLPLHATSDWRHACFWVTYPRLPPGDILGTEQDALVLWPAGYHAREDPLRVVDHDGEVVAVDGDTAFTVTGPTPEEGECNGRPYEYTTRL